MPVKHAARATEVPWEGLAQRVAVVERGGDGKPSSPARRALA
jgi:hypothetical protein